MPDTSEFMRQQAARLFAVALDARRDGHFDVATILTEAATRYLDRAEELEGIAAPPFLKEEFKPVAQQQQQVQPHKGDEES